MSSTPPTLVVLVPPPNSILSLMLDPPLPRSVAWVPVVCRGLALFIAFPFVCLILLDIVAYLIARTLHLRPTILRVPRSPLSNLKPELVDVKSEEVGGCTEKESGLGADLGRGDQGEDDSKQEGEGEVLVEGLPVGRVQDEQVSGVGQSQEKLSGETKNISLGVPVGDHHQHDRHRNLPSPALTLPDELDIDARFGIEHKEMDDMDKACPEGLADEALGSWNPSRSSAASKVEENVHKEEEEQKQQQEQAQEQKQQENLREKKWGHEPVKGRLGEPSVHLGKWEPVDFAKQFAGLNATKGDETGEDDPAIKDLGERLAKEDEGVHQETQDVEEKVDLTTNDLRKLLQEAQQHKLEGNTLFQAAEPDLDGAIGAYKAALEILPTTSLTPQPKAKEPDVGTNGVDGKAKDPATGTSGVVELTDEQAEAIKVAEEEAEAEAKRREEEERDPVVMQKREVEREIEDVKKAVWGNLGAVWVKKGDDKEVMTACAEALKLDPTYVKVLQRRALAGERIASWSSLTTSQEDYTILTQILPKSSPLYHQAQRALNTLPTRIRTQQEKEKDEMLSKLKELGDGLLGRFGLSTNNFKFDKQEGGGYSMRFEQ